MNRKLKLKACSCYTWCSNQVPSLPAPKFLHVDAAAISAQSGRDQVPFTQHPSSLRSGSRGLYLGWACLGTCSLAPTDGVTRTCLWPTASWPPVTQHWTNTFLSAPQLTALPGEQSKDEFFPFLFQRASGTCPFLPTLSFSSIFLPAPLPLPDSPHTAGWRPVNCVTTPFNLLFPCSKASDAFPFLPKHSGSQNFLKPRRAQKQPYVYIEF